MKKLLTSGVQVFAAHPPKILANLNANRKLFEFPIEEIKLIRNSADDGNIRNIPQHFRNVALVSEILQMLSPERYKSVAAASEANAAA